MGRISNEINTLATLNSNIESTVAALFDVVEHLKFNHGAPPEEKT